MNPQINTIDFNERPFIAIWEVTQACDLACVHCRASAQPDRHPMELSTDEGKHLIDQIAALKVPVFVLTGGDPIKRPDLFELIGHARSVGVRVSLTPSATPLLTQGDRRPAQGGWPRQAGGEHGWRERGNPRRVSGDERIVCADARRGSLGQ